MTDAQATDPQGTGPQGTSSQPISKETGPLQVLLVEDNPGDARLFEEYLREGPVEATCRHELTLEAGLEALRKDRPDVLALDLGLPDSEGTETVAAVAQAAPKLPIVVLTGQDDLNVALQAQEAGAAEYLQKEDLSLPLLARTLRWAAQRARMQAKLRQRDAWIRSITEGLSAGAFRCGPTGRIQYANEALAKMLGFGSGEELVGRDLTEFYADPLGRGRMLAEERAEGAKVEFKRADGESLVGLLSAEAVYDADERLVHYDGTITDITEQVERERALERKNARLDSFAGLVSHDLRNPLNVATGRLQLAKEERDLSHLEAVEEALGRMDAIIEDVLTLTWGGRDLDSEDLAIRNLEALAEAAWDQVDTAGASLQLGDPLSLRCGENRLQRLLENLFRNAVEHGGEAPTVRVGGLPGGFYVEDDGPGFSDENPEAIFDAGYSSNEEGTGLGLSIVKSIAETHGWALTATESPAGGARFEIMGVDETAGAHT